MAHRIGRKVHYGNIVGGSVGGVEGLFVGGEGDSPGMRPVLTYSLDASGESKTAMGLMTPAFPSGMGSIIFCFTASIRLSFAMRSPIHRYGLVANAVPARSRKCVLIVTDSSLLSDAASRSIHLISPGRAVRITRCGDTPLVVGREGFYNVHSSVAVWRNLQCPISTVVSY